LKITLELLPVEMERVQWTRLH